MDGPFWVDLRAPHMSADAGSVTLTAAAKAMVPVANLPPLGANYFSFVGKAVRLTMHGRITTAATPGNMQFSLYWGNGTDANGTIIASSLSTIALIANQANMSWRLEMMVRCRALGATGSLIGNGMLSFNPAVIASTNQPILIPATAPAAVTVDLTANNFLSPQFLRSGSTVETLQVHEYAFEAMN
jgi:hypothetical protein